MSYRPFSNNKIISYSDYNNKKINNCKQIYKNKYINSSSKVLNLKKKCINNCLSLYPCVKAPMTLIQGKTSYICNKNISEDDVCKILKQTLYPYGYYLCKNSVCNTCVNTSSESTQNVTTDTVSNQTINNYNVLDLFVQ